MFFAGLFVSSQTTECRIDVKTYPQRDVQETIIFTLSPDVHLFLFMYLLLCTTRCFLVHLLGIFFCGLAGMFMSLMNECRLAISETFLYRISTFTQWHALANESLIKIGPIKTTLYSMPLYSSATLAKFEVHCAPHFGVLLHDQPVPVSSSFQGTPHSPTRRGWGPTPPRRQRCLTLPSRMQLCSRAVNAPRVPCSCEHASFRWPSKPQQGLALARARIVVVCRKNTIP